jgi:plastocyanin
MKKLAPAVLLPIVVLTLACSEQGASRLTSTAPTTVGNPGADVAENRPNGTRSTVATPSTATVQFGKPNTGSPFPPTPPHDRSAHAVDNMVPRTVVIDVGGEVTFNVPGVHQVAIYAPGTEPDDIDTSNLVLMPPGCPRPGGVRLMINDSENREALYAQQCLPGGGTRVVRHQFTRPGRYLVICAFLPHFEVQMYGWVEVRER